MSERQPKIQKRKTLNIDQPYLILPQSLHPPIDQYREVLKDMAMTKSVFWPLMYREEPSSTLTVKVGDRTLFSQPHAMPQREPQDWAAIEVSEWMGQTLEISAELDADEVANFDAIHLAADLTTQLPDLYHEANRPQFHFAFRTGCLGDPTAMVYYPPRQEWHLFTIHNPLRGREICWGHAVSKDLLHWEERAPIFHAPYHLYNGAGFTDTRNLLGLNRDGEQAIVLLIPHMGREPGYVSMTVSIDGGETFHDIDDLKRDLGRDDLPDNPVTPGWGDAPRIHWNPVAEKYFLPHCRWHKKGVDVLQYTSPDLHEWTRIDDFPLVIYDNFPGEGDPPDGTDLTLDDGSHVYVLLGGRNGYVICRYGEAGLTNLQGEPISPADTIPTQHNGFPTMFADAPGNRGIAMYNVGSDRIPGIPQFEVGYKANMSFPVELALRETADGLRLFQNPIAEIEQLYGATHRIGEVTLGAETVTIDGPAGGLYRIQATLDGGSAEAIDLIVMGYTLTYDVKNGTLGAERDTTWWPDRETSSASGHHRVTQDAGCIQIDLLVDRTSIEIFPNAGERYLHYGKLELYKHRGPHIQMLARGGTATVRDLLVIEINPIW